MSTDSQPNASQETRKGPTAGFQTVWVQKQLEKLRSRTGALRAQHIDPKDTF